MLINIGFGNVINTEKVLAIVSPNSAPAKRLIGKSKEEERVIDATQGRKTKAVIVTDNNYVVLSAMTPETLVARWTGKDNMTPKGKDTSSHAE